MINKSNYHIYAIDYIEGNLEPELKKEFEKFLANNPEIRQEIDELKDFTLPQYDANLDLTDKIKLKKSSIEGLSYFEQLCIEEIENTITQQQRKELYELISSSAEHKKIFEQYKLTKLQPPKVFFPYKETLKKSATYNFAIKTIISFAAIILIALSIINLKLLLPSRNNSSLPQAITIVQPQWKALILPENNKQQLSSASINKKACKHHPVTIKKAITKTPQSTNIQKHNEQLDLAFTPPSPDIATPQNTQININLSDITIYTSQKTSSTVPQNTNKTAAIIKNLKTNLSRNLRTLAYKKALALRHHGLRIKIKNKVYGIYVSR